MAERGHLAGERIDRVGVPAVVAVNVRRDVPEPVEVPGMHFVVPPAPPVPAVVGRLVAEPVPRSRVTNPDRPPARSDRTPLLKATLKEASLPEAEARLKQVSAIGERPIDVGDLRALAVREAVGTEEASQLLEKLAARGRGANLTLEVQAALERLKPRARRGR